MHLITGDTIQGLAGTAAVLTYTINGTSIVAGSIVQVLATGQLSAVNSTLYTTVGTRADIYTITLANTSASPVSGIILSINGSTPNKRIIGELTIPAKGTANYSEGKWQVIDANGSIVMSFSGGGGVAVSAGTNSYSTGTVVFSNSNGVSFGLNTNNVMTASVGVAGGGLTNINISAGITSNDLSALTFDNSNGVSFGLTGSVLTASVFTDYQSTGAYLTTARASNDAIGLNTAITANGVSMSANSSGLSLNFPAFLTTAQPVGAYLTTAALSQDSSKYAGTNGAITGGSITVNTSGVSINLPAYLTTAQPVGAYLTTAMASDAGSNFIGLNTALTGNGVSATINSSGISLNVPAFLTTAQSPGAYLTTAMASNAATISNINISAGTTSNNLSALTFANSNNLSFGLDGSTVTGSFGMHLSAGNGIQTTVSALTFANSNGVTFGLNAGVLTATVVNSHTLGLYAVGNTTQSSSGSMNIQTVSFRGEGVASVGVSNGSVVISVPAGGGGLTNINVSAGTTSNNLSALTFSNANGLSFGLNGSVITGSCDGNITYNGFNPRPNMVEAYQAQGAGTLHVQPLQCPNITFDRIVMGLQYSNATNSSNSCTVSLSFGIYSRNVSTLSLIGSNSTSYNVTNSGTVGSYSLYGGPRLITLGMSSSLSAGDYYIGIWSRTTTGGGAGMTINQIANSKLNSNYSGLIGAANNVSRGSQQGLGVYSVSFSTAMPNAISLTQIVNGTASGVMRTPFYSFAHTTY